MDPPSKAVPLQSPRPPARELRLSSSFKPLPQVAGASGTCTPTRALLGRVSDIMARDAEQGPDAQHEWVQAVSACLTNGSKLRSCLSSGRHSDSAIPAASAARAAAHSSEHRGLHWKPELVAVSAADQRSENRELQARYLKLEADLQESEAAKALLQKQLHRVQEAMKQNRDDLENAQRSALAAQETAAAAEAKAASLAAEVAHLQKELEKGVQGYNVKPTSGIHDKAQNAAIPFKVSLAGHSMQPATAAVSSLASRKLLFPEARAAPASHSTSHNPAAGSPQSPLTGRQDQSQLHGHGQQQVAATWVGQMPTAQIGLTANTQLQTLTVGKCMQLPGSPTRQFAPAGAGQSHAAGQGHSHAAGQGHTLEAGQRPRNSPGLLPQGNRWQHRAEVCTESLAALQTAAKSNPSWAHTTLHSQPGTAEHHGFLASTVMLETLGRQKQALLLHENSKSCLKQKGRTGGSGEAGQEGCSPASPTSHKWVTLHQQRATLYVSKC